LELLPACFPHLAAFAAPLCTEICDSASTGPCGYTYGDACAGFIRKWSDTLVSLDLGSVPAITVDDVIRIVQDGGDNGDDDDGDGDDGDGAGAGHGNSGDCDGDRAKTSVAVPPATVDRALARLTRLRLPGALRASREKIDERLERARGGGGGGGQRSSPTGGGDDRRRAPVAVDWLALPEIYDQRPQERQPVAWLTD
jgi:hypothetical protein